MKRILVCDDDEGILEVTKIALEQEEYQVISLQKSENLLQEIKKHQPNLILIDLLMPGLSGGEVVKTIKKDEDIKNIPIIIISASDEIEKIANNVGADGFISKPFELEDLYRVVRKKAV